jgi:phage tail sheath gpL-like
MAASIVLTGLSANDPVPGTYLEVNFAQGQASGSGTARTILLMGNRTSGGSATVATVYGPDTATPLQTEADAIALFGAGSELHRMFRRVTAVNNITSVYAIAVADAAGTAASNTIVYANAATGAGVTRVWVEDEFVDVSIASGDSATTIGTAVKNAINTKTHWAVVATDSTGTVTLTAKNTGPRGNTIRYFATITSGIATTVTNTGSVLASGATQDNFTNALAAILSKKFYYIVPACIDATNLGLVNTQVLAQALPVTGIRQRWIAGSVDSLGNATTVATTLNSSRGCLVWQPSSDWTPWLLAANLAGVVALYEAENDPKPRHNFSGFGSDVNTQASWRVRAPISGTVPTRADVKSALNNGITPIQGDAQGNGYLVKLITTRSLTSAVADYRIRDWHKVTVCDFFADAIYAKTTLQFSGFDLASDVADGARPPGSTVLTPSRYRAAVFRVINDFDEQDQLQNAAAIKAGTVVQRATSPTTRLEARIPLQPIDICDQFAVAVDQVA